MYWNLLVVLKKGLISSTPVCANLCPLWILASRKSTSVSCMLWVYFKLGCCSFSAAINRSSFSLPCVHIIKMSSMYLFQSWGCSVWLSRNSFSMEAIKMLAKVGANFVPIAVPHICLYILSANSKMLCLRIICMRLLRFFLSESVSGNLSKW